MMAKSYLLAISISPTYLENFQLNWMVFEVDEMFRIKQRTEKNPNSG